MGKELTIPGVDIARRQASALLESERTEVARIQADALIEVARTQAEIARIQSYEARSLEWMRLDAAETHDLIASATTAMSQTISIYSGSAPRYLECEVKTKLRGLFGKSCKISVKARRSEPTLYLRGPGR